MLYVQQTRKADSRIDNIHLDPNAKIINQNHVIKIYYSM